MNDMVMKNFTRNILALVAMVMCSLHCFAVEPAEHDTVYFYDTWEQMFDLQPVAMVVDPYIEAFTPYEVYIITGDENINEMLLDDHLAISLGDSTMLISSKYLKNNFKGSVRDLRGFIPVFFNEKVAYITYNANMGVKEILFGNNWSFEDGEAVYKSENYYIDFLNRRVERVTSTYLSSLLEDYHDLQMRYEGMKDYKKKYIIDDYFLKFIDRASEDFMRPYILDLQ